MSTPYFGGEPSELLLALRVRAWSSEIAAWDEAFQYAASIVSIAAGALLRRSSLPFVPRGELRDLPYLDRSGRSRDRRDHQFPLQREAFDRPCDETRSRSRALWQDANRMAIGNHALHPVLSFRAEARPHHDLSTGEVLPSDPRCFIPQADEGARATAPTRPDHFPAPSFPTTDRWCDKHRSVPAFVRLLTAASVTLSRDIRHTQLLHYFVAWVDLLSLSGGYPPT